MWNVLNINIVVHSKERNHKEVQPDFTQYNISLMIERRECLRLRSLSSKRFSITCHCLSVRSICKIPFYYSLSTISSLYSKTKGDKKRPTDRLLNQIKAISFIYFDFTRYHDSTDTIDWLYRILFIQFIERGFGILKKTWTMGCMPDATFL